MPTATCRCGPSSTSRRRAGRNPGGPDRRCRARCRGGPSDRCRNRAAKFERPTVFAPPVCTFRSATKAAETDLANGLCLAVECDERPTEACRRLIGLLGGVTAIVASGGEWADPKPAGCNPGSMSCPAARANPDRAGARTAQAREPAGGRPGRLRSIGCAVGSSFTLGWFGSPQGGAKLCRIAALQEFEIDLDDAAERLEQAARLALEHASGPDADRLRVALDTHEARGADRQTTTPTTSTRTSKPSPTRSPTRTNPAPSGSRRAGVLAASDGSAAVFNAWDRRSRNRTNTMGDRA